MKEYLMKKYIPINESEDSMGNVISEPLNGMEEELIQSFLTTEIQNMGMLNKADCKDYDEFIDHFMNYCYSRNLYPDYVSLKTIPGSFDKKTGKRENPYVFSIFDFHYLSKKEPIENTITVGLRIDEDDITYSLSLYFY